MQSLSGVGGWLKSFGDVKANTGITSSIVKKCTGQSPSQIDWKAPAPIDYGTLLSSTQLNAVLTTGNGTLVYDQNVGDKLEPGDHPLRVVVAETWSYAGAEKTVTITVNKLKPVISWSSLAAIDYGTKLSDAQLNAEAKHKGNAVNGTMTYNPAKDTILDAGLHSLAVSFVPSDATHYDAPDPKKTQLSVRKVAPEVKWPPPAKATYGKALKDAPFTAKATYDKIDVPGKTEYDEGPDTIKDVGDNKCKVTFVPDNQNYASMGGTVTLVIEQAPVTITWNNPASITYGTRIDVTQLNATCDVEGTFQYDPGKQKKLDGGLGQKLGATFTPTIKKNYKTGKADVTIDVTPATPVIAWTPLEIKQNTNLGGPQLNATASFSYQNPDGTTAKENPAGNYVYNPLSGSNAGIAGTLALAVTFTPKNTRDYNPVVKNVTVAVVRSTVQERRSASITQPMEDKILRGEVRNHSVTGPYFVGAHSSAILVDLTCVCTSAGNNTNGTRKYNVTKIGSGCPAKFSTLPPVGWTDDEFWEATVATARTPATATDGFGNTTHQLQHNGINWEVIKDNTGNVTAAYPTA